jgi:DNA-binding response OmpR family regulator
MPARVLFVDDDAAILQLFRTVLELEGYEVETAPSAAHAQQMLAEHSYDMVITDMRMETPVSGFQVVHAAARMNPRPVIAIMTAYPMLPNDWKDSGADALFTKGTSPITLTAKLRDLLRRHGKGSDKPGPAEGHTAMRARM